MVAGKSICFCWKYLIYLLLLTNHCSLFSKWPFGKVRVIYRSFQKSWLKERPFLHRGYDEAKDQCSAFCHTCAIAVKGKKIRAATAEASFVSD